MASYSQSAGMYETLDTSRQAIRLLEFESTVGDDDMVKCRLITVCLEDQPEYIALSYTWGDAVDAQRIVVNGNTISATKNVVCALQQLRHDLLKGPLCRL
jgi:hypothetical protein